MPHDAPFSIFREDGFNRLLARLGLGSPAGPRLWARIPALVVLTWGPLVALAAREGHLLGATYRESLLADLAAYAQFVGFLPLALAAEPFIDGKMGEAWLRLHALADPAVLSAIGRRTRALARARLPDLLLLVGAYAMTSSWALDEVTNGIPSWHTAVGDGGETFTWAGWWVTVVSLPLFTYLWMRWAWKIAVWTLCLLRLSRVEHRLVPTHPDRTGGLGCLSEVQTSFAVILFGTGLLFSAAMGYKVVLEGTPPSSYTVWFPVVGYVLLAPAVFLAPLFLFTRALARAKRDALRRLDGAAVVLSKQFERRWLREAGTPGEDLLDDQAPSVLADFRAAWETVAHMRVVPFDLRSLTELVTSSAAPFAPLLWAAELPDRLRQLRDLLAAFVSG